MSSPAFYVLTLAASLAMTVGSEPAVLAQSPPLSAQESDPKVLGWMEGFPPPEDKIITQPDSVYFSFPRLRWTVSHVRELLPTEEISRGLNAPVPLNYLSVDELKATRQVIDALTFTPLGSGKEMTWEESLYANYTDGILIIHKGRVVYERYFGSLAEDGKHAAMSMTKSLTGLLAEILVAEGKLDENSLVSTPRAGDQGQRLRVRHDPAGDGYDHGSPIFGGLCEPQCGHLDLFSCRQSTAKARRL